jgi:hypothetical protein
MASLGEKSGGKRGLDAGRAKQLDGSMIHFIAPRPGLQTGKRCA